MSSGPGWNAWMDFVLGRTEPRVHFLGKQKQKSPKSAVGPNSQSCTNCKAYLDSRCLTVMSDPKIELQQAIL